jgi:membrane-associated protease RseP (regulator of RpoE activity)
MLTNRMCFASLAGWAAVAVLALPASLCLAQQELPPTPQDLLPSRPVHFSEYWLGVVSEPLPEPLQAQLNLPENQGLLVEQVAPDSPAAAAAIRQYDVLLKANGKPVAAVRDLVAAVDAAKGTKMQLELLRKGKPVTVEVTPAKRPLGEAARLMPPTGGEPWGEAMRKWSEQFRPGEPRDRDYSFFFVRPGVVLGHPNAVPDLPPNVTVSVTKQGKSPAKIVVTRDKDKWEVSENELDKLPADLRPHVEAMVHDVLARGLSKGRLPGLSGVPVPPRSRADRMEHQPGAGIAAESSRPVEKQLEEMNRRLDEMRKAVEELKRMRSTTPETVLPPPAQPPKQDTKPR